MLGPTSLTQPYQSTADSINTNPINGANLIGTNNTEYGIVTDNTAVMVAAKYTWDPFKLFGGYEHILQLNPANPLGVGATAQGGYLLERRRRQQSRFSQDRAGLLDGREIRLQ